jgi:hypothetical protein
MGTYTKNLKLETPSYTDNADIPALAKKNNEIIDSEMIKRANGLDYNEQTGVLQLTGNNSKVGSPIQIKNNLPVTSMASGTELKVNNYKQLIKFTKEGKAEQKTYTGKNLFYDTPSSTTSNGITLTKNSDGSFTLNGTTTGVSIFDFRLPKALPAGIYTFSIEGSDNIPGDVFLRARDNNGAMVETQSQVNGNNTTQNSHTFTCKKDISIVAINITRAGITFNNFVIYPQLEKGTTATKFEPYVGATPSPNPDYPQKIKNVRGVENLLNIPDGTYENNGITAVIKDGVITLNGTATSTSFIKINLEKLKSGTYSMSANNEQVVGSTNVNNDFAAYRLANRNTAETLKDCVFGKKNSTANFIISNDININFTIRTAANLTYNNFVIKPQLEEGLIVHDYVPYGSNYLQLKNTTDNKSKIINIDLKGNELCSNKEQTLKDELVIENGRAKIYKKIKEVVLDGSENWIKSGGSSSSRFVASLEITNIMKTKTFNALCNYFTYNIEFGIAKFHLFNTNTDGTARFIAFGVDASTISDLTQWKALLKSLYDSGNPVKVQYELAEPKVIDLGEIDFDLIENSTLTCEEESNMQIDYLTISSNIFVQDSLDGSSSQKAPSIDAVNKAINKISNYSSEEQEIGEWFGEKHYRKVFKIDMDSTSKGMTIPTGIDMKQLTHAYGVALYNGTIYLPLNFYNNLGWDSFHLIGKGANIILQRGDNFSITKVFITLEYTKNV